MLLLVLATVGTGGAVAAERYALIVAAGDYPHLSPRLQLAGPANDADLVRDWLLSRGFPSRRITVLEDGWFSTRPTKAAILDALGDLANRVTEGDLVYLHFSGHGSQQPAAAGEPDGWDELFLPVDVKAWRGSVGGVEGALTDDEMGAAIDALRRRGAFVWAVFDSCHSGDLLRRGDALERQRWVSPGELGVPGTPPTVRGSFVAGEPWLGLDSRPVWGDYVAFYAAQPHQTTPELALPLGSARRKPHGLFTYTLLKALGKRPNASYRQVMAEVLAHYEAALRAAPVPLLEGTALDTPVLTQGPPGVSLWPVTAEEAGTWTVAAGGLHQLAAGSLLALVGRDGATAVGYLEVGEGGPLTSAVDPIAFAGRPAPTEATLATAPRARLERPAFDFVLRVGRLSGGRGRAAALLERLAARPAAGWTWVAPGEPAQVWLEAAGNAIAVWPAGAPGTGVPMARVDAAGGEAALARQLTALRRGRGLLAAVERLPPLGDDLQLTVGVKGGCGEVDFDRCGQPVTPLEPGALATLVPGDKLQLTVVNSGHRPWDTHLLLLDKDYQLTLLSPRPGQSSRLQPQERRVLTGGIAPSERGGRERLLLIAAASTPGTPPLDLGFLTRGVAPAAVRREGAGGGALAALLAQAGGLVARSQPRPVAAAALTTLRAGLVVWRTQNP
ncbi:MAG: caspase domain-containing protein [Candidatus Competibacterales bacterium]